MRMIAQPCVVIGLRPGLTSSDERAFDEPLPWLAPVEDEDEPRGISARKMLAALLVVLVAAAIVARDLLLDRPPQRRGRTARRS